MVVEGNSSFSEREPGIYSQAQVNSWKNVTRAVHKQGGRIILQLWHGGRACHPYFNAGAQPVAPSPLAITGDEIHTPEGKKPYVIPRELRDDELPAIIAGFRTAAHNAKAADFDGVDIHGANGYLIDEFLRDAANKRVDPYGGPIALTAYVAAQLDARKIAYLHLMRGAFMQMQHGDVVARLHAGAVLAEPDASTFYSHDARGFTDYPTMGSA